MMNTKARYTVIASAQRTNNTPAANIVNHIDAGFQLAAMGFTKSYDVQGFYREAHNAQASIELSRAIAVSSLDEVSQLATLFCGGYAQECILAINNKTKDVFLIDVNGLICAKLGKWKAHAAKVESWDAYTYDGMHYYTAE